MLTSAKIERAGPRGLATKGKAFADEIVYDFWTVGIHSRSYDRSYDFELDGHRANVRQTNVVVDDLQDPAALDRRGVLLAARGDTARALADLDRACELAPNNPEVFFHRALIKVQVKQSDAALEDLDHALGLRPDYANALISRAQLRLDKRETTATIADLDAADHVADEDARLQMGQEYLAAEEYGKASTQLKRWADTHKGDPNMLVLERLKSQSPMRARLLNDRAILQLRLGTYAKCIDDDNESLRINPKDADALYSRGMALGRGGKTEAANADFNAARTLNPTIDERHAKLGLAL